MDLMQMQLHANGFNANATARKWVQCLLHEVAEGSDGVVSILITWLAMLQLQQACLLAELLLAVMLQHLAESGGDPSALSRLGDNRVSLHVRCMLVCACSINAVQQFS